jgi:hypothetical protein
MQSNTVKRARKLAKPTWSNQEGRSGQDFADLLDEEAYLNSTIDFSFHLDWQGSGDWSDHEQYRVDVSSKSRDIIPEKESDAGSAIISSISLDNIGRKAK